MSKTSARFSPRTLRDLHLYLAVFFAPTILFFALTGAIQVLGLHEASRDGGYAPPALVEKLSQVHIHQRFAAPPRRPPPSAAARAPGGSQAQQRLPRAEPPVSRRGPSLGTRLAKWFFAAAATGLTASALLGIWIAITQFRRRPLAWGLLAGGAALPLLLLIL